MTRPRPRPELSSLQPYRTAESKGGRVMLHSNENPYPPPPDVVDEIHALARKHSLNRYPDAEPTELIAEIASYAGVDPSWVWIGDGANEVLLQACLAYGGPGRTAVLFQPTYRMHHRQARMAGTAVVDLRRRDDFSIDIDAACDAIESSKPDVVFVCTPNNPTGTPTAIEDLRRLANASPGLFIVDEAYFEFSGDTFVRELAQHENVLVVRTFSKAFRLAAVRLGYGIAHPDLLEEMRRVRMPYAQSAFTQAAALVALRRREVLLDAVPKIVAERERVTEALAAMSGVAAIPSRANFVLFRHRAGAEVSAALADRGIVVRDFSHLEGCEGCIRVTIGTPEENDEFLEAVATAAH